MDFVALRVDEPAHVGHPPVAQGAFQGVGAETVDVQNNQFLVDELAAHPQKSAKTGRWSEARTLSVQARWVEPTAPPA